MKANKSLDTIISHRINSGTAPEVDRNKKITDLYLTGFYSYSSLARMFKVTSQRIAVIVPQDAKDKVKALREVKV